MAIESQKPYFQYFFLLLVFCCLASNSISRSHFNIHEATIEQIHYAFANSQLTSRQLTDLYLQQIQTLNPTLRAVIEVNPDALHQADQADKKWRGKKSRHQGLGSLHGIPVLLKDSIATEDKMNTTAGSYALLGSVVPRDAMVVEKLRKAGAVILGKASQSEWYHLRSMEKIPDGWCARSGQGLNPYVEMGNPGGSSSGSAISVAANMVAVSLGTETDGSIILPADRNSVVGIKPTVGLTSRAGVVPVSARMDTVGPICRTVSDAVHVLDAIVGYDPRDHEATAKAAKFIPKGGYRQFLDKDGLKGKRLGIVRTPFINHYINDSFAVPAFEHHISTLRLRGAVVIDHLEIPNVNLILSPYESGEFIALASEFKSLFSNYLKDLIISPVRSLADIIAFNMKNPVLEKLEEYGQDTFLAVEMMNVTEAEVNQAVEAMKGLCKEGLEKLMKENQLDAIVTLGPDVATVLAIGGYPGISVPAGYSSSNGMPFGICFGGLRGSEPKLIEIAYGFEQATSVRKPPFSKAPNCGEYSQFEL
uniref:Amidase domain-containing protein n=1 Tax=Kalanchoe fedtschenkoi TaxID=63787 RepID=A0A7N0U5X9_KALFE